MDSGISGIISCYNSEAFIENTLDSIFNQTAALSSLILVDDCSSDATIDAVHRYVTARGLDAGAVTVLPNRINLGISMSYNLGIMACRTRYAMLFSHDDISHPDRVKSTLKAFAEGAAIVCSYMDVPASGQKITLPEMPSLVALGLALGNVVPAPTVSLDVDIARQNKLYFNPQNDYAEDYDLWCQYILRGYSFHVVPEFLVAYTLHDQQASVTRQAHQKLVAERVRLQYIRSLFPFLQPEQSEVLVRILLYEKHMLGHISQSFNEAILNGMEKQSVAPGVQSVYGYVRQMLTSPVSAPVTAQ